MRQSVKAFTLVEILVVVSIIVLLMAVAMPNIPGMMRSNKMSGAKNLITTALAQAQSYAASHSKYAGIRFQKAANGRTYLVLIEHDPQFPWVDVNGYAGNGTGVTYQGYCPFRYVAVPNASPKALPDGVGILDGNFATKADKQISNTDDDGTDDNENDCLVYYDSAVASPFLTGGAFACIENFQTFTIVFSPAGQLVSERVEVQPRRDGNGNLLVDLDEDPLTPLDWYDSIFGPADLAAVEKNPEALLSYDNFYDYFDFNNVYTVQTYTIDAKAYYTIDDSPSPWNVFYSNKQKLGAGASILADDQYENSTTSLFIYMEEEMKEVPNNSRYTDYFKLAEYGETVGCEKCVLNIYTGSIIDE